MGSRGIFIVLEGLDRCGKSTQVDRLVARLSAMGRKARLQKFPGKSADVFYRPLCLAALTSSLDRTTAIGRMIDSYLQSQSELDDHAIHLLFSANRWECAAAIERDLQDGITVVADRYAFSGIAFSAAKGLPFDFCLNPDAGLPLPDATLYFTIPPDVASSRASYGVERYETIEMQRRVKDQFERVAEEVRRRHGPERWTEISAGGSIEEVGELVWTRVEAVSAGTPAKGRLWIE